MYCCDQIRPQSLPVVTVPPGPPPDFRAVVVSDDSITLKWGPSPIQTGIIYEICNGTSPVCVEVSM